MILLCLLLLLRCTGFESLPLCYSSYKDVLALPIRGGKSLEGNWFSNVSYSHPGKFAYQKDFKLWLSSACPIQSRVFSFRRSNDIRNENTASKSKYIPTSCKLNEFDAASFLNTIRNRNLIHFGDSLVLQFVTMLICSLDAGLPINEIKYERVRWVDYGTQFGRRDCPYQNGSYCHIEDVKVVYPGYNASIEFIPDYHRYRPTVTIFSFLRHRNFTSSDILLVSLGLHYNTPDELRNRLRRFFHPLVTSHGPLHLVEESKHSRTSLSSFADFPVIIWRESSAQHFRSTPSGYYADEEAINNHSCVPYSNQLAAFQGDYRNRIVEEFFYENSLSIPIMRIWNISSSAYDQHTGLQNRTDEKRKKYDCTHFWDESGVFYAWREIFFNVLPIILDAVRNNEYSVIMEKKNPLVSR
jgi:hypothetical protein